MSLLDKLINYIKINYQNIIIVEVLDLYFLFLFAHSANKKEKKDTKEKEKSGAPLEIVKYFELQFTCHLK